MLLQKETYSKEEDKKIIKIKIMNMKIVANLKVV
jgi:hypothetical protein